MLSQNPLKDLNKIGFAFKKSGEHSKWRFTEEIMRGTINNYAVFVHVDRSNKKTIAFKVPVTTQVKIDKIEYKRLVEKYKKLEIDLSYGGFSKAFPIGRLNQLSINDFQCELENYIHEIAKEKFEPLKY